MSDTSTEAVERLADGIEATLTKRLNLGPGVKSMESDTLRALAAERDALKRDSLKRDALVRCLNSLEKLTARDAAIVAATLAKLEDKTDDHTD